jgi:four helix bundle protein
MHRTDNLVVAASAHRLAIATYRHTGVFPAAERFGMTSQMRRAAVSIASNIAEGCGRSSNRELLRFLYYASGSTSELACRLRIATQLGFGDRESAESHRVAVVRVGKLPTQLITALRTESEPANQPTSSPAHRRHGVNAINFPNSRHVTSTTPLSLSACLNSGEPSTSKSR